MTKNVLNDKKTIFGLRKSMNPSDKLQKTDPRLRRSEIESYITVRHATVHNKE